MNNFYQPLSWHPIPGFEAFYVINELGTIKCLRKRAINAKANGNPEKQYICTHKNNYGYLQVKLSKNGKTSTCYVHRLLALTFLPKPVLTTEVNHRDGNKLNNNLGNLEWVSHQENMSHASRLGLITYKMKPVFDKCSKRSFRSAKEAATANGIEYNTLRGYLNGQVNNPTCLSYNKQSRRN